MSTVRMNITSGRSLFNARFAQLAKTGVLVFHTNDLASLWQIKDKNNLYTTLKRYTQKGLLNRIYKGLYSLKPLDQLDPWLLGVKVLHEYAYISTETILFQAGIINQAINQITLISSQSRRFTVGEWNYRTRKLADKFLYQDAGIIERDGVKIATLARAVADMLYFDAKYHFDFESNIDWIQVKKLQKILEYPLTTNRYHKL